jgi:WD40 repeat protein
VAFLPDGKTLVTAGQDDVIRLWDVETGRERRHIVPGEAAEDGQGRGRRRGGVGPVRAIPMGGSGLGFVALSPDGKLLATLGPDRSVALWDTATAKKVQQIKELKGTATSLAFSPDSKTIVSRNQDGKFLQQWEIASGKEVRQFGIPPEKNQAIFFGGGPSSGAPMCFSPDGKTLVSVATDLVPGAMKTTIKFWEAGTGRELHEVKAPDGAFTMISPVFTPDGKYVAWDNMTGTVGLYDPATGNQVRQIKISAGGLVPFAFSPDGKRMVTRAMTDATIRAWDVESGTEVKDWALPEQRRVRGAFDVGFSRCLAFSADGKKLALGGTHHAVRLLDATSGKDLGPIGGHVSPVSTLLYSQDGKTITSGSQDATLRIWDSATGAEKQELSLPKEASETILSPDGKTFAGFVLGNNAHIALWDAATGKAHCKITLPDKGFGNLTFSPDSKLLALRDAGNQKIYLFDTAQGKELRALSWKLDDDKAPKGPPGVVIFSIGGNAWQGVAFSPDSRWVAGALSADTAGIWQVDSGKALNISTASKKTIENGIFSPDGRTIALALADQSIGLFEVATGSQRCALGETPGELSGTASFVQNFGIAGGMRFLAFSAPAPDFAFSPDGRLLAQGLADHSISLWDVATGKQVGRLVGHQGPIQTVVFAPDGNTLATGSSDTTALVWDMKEAAKKVQPAVAELPISEVEPRWSELANADAAKSFTAIKLLASSPTSALALLHKNLKPIEPTDAKRVAAWIAGLDSEEFSIREEAREELEKQGELAISALRTALAGKPSEEARRHLEELLDKATSPAVSGERLRQLRAVEVLERMNTPEAKKLLEDLARGAPGVSQTQAAQAALQRMKGYKN